MPGNSQRKGAIRKRASGNPTAGSGGRVRAGVSRARVRRRRRPTARTTRRHKAEDARDERRSRPAGRARQSRRSAGRRRSGSPAATPSSRRCGPACRSSRVYVAEGTERDDRLREAFKLAADRGISLLEVTRAELDRMTDGAVHQGLALQVPAYEYAAPGRPARRRAPTRGEPPLIVALDSVTDPRNLGAVVRSAAAFGAHGVVIPERRAAGMTASAWKTSAGAAARMPVAQATNLTRQLKAYQRGRLHGGRSGRRRRLSDLADLDLAVGTAGARRRQRGRRACPGWSGETCDVLVRIPMRGALESLNAGVAAGIALYEISRRRA